LPDAHIHVSRDTVIAGLLKEALDEGPGSSQSCRIKAWELLAKVSGLMTPDKEEAAPRVRFDIRLDATEPDASDAA
jgi:hypothetical protein